MSSLFLEILLKRRELCQAPTVCAPQQCSGLQPRVVLLQDPSSSMWIPKVILYLKKKKERKECKEADI